MQAIEPWVLWLAAALILFGVDILVAGGASGVLLLFALMAGAGTVAALLGLSLTAQISFAAISGLVFLPVILVVMRRITKGRKAEHAEGRMATETFILQQQGSGLQVKALGDTYPVKAEQGVANDQLKAGTEVRILRFEGITAIVMPVSKRSPHAD